MPGTRRRDVGICFVAVFLYLTAWAFINPPLQGPDEFAHLTKALSVPSNPWITHSPRLEIYDRWYNPLLASEALRGIPGHPERMLPARQIDALKQVPFPTPSETWRSSLWGSNAYYYPTPYYGAVFALGQGITSLFGLTPYESIYAFRIASALLSAALWSLVFARLAFLREHRTRVFALVLLHPMVGLLGSCITLDAVFIPLCTLAILYSFHAVVLGRDLGATICIFVALVFTKSTAGILVPPTLTLLVVLAWLLERARPRGVRIHWANAAILIVGALAVYFLAYYVWSPRLMDDIGRGRLPRPLVGYWVDLPWRAWPMFASFWLVLGLPDTLAPLWVYLPVLVLILMNGAAFVFFRELPDQGRVLFVLGFALLYCVVLVGAEFWYAAPVRLLMGRYFLPVVLGFAILTCHPAAWLRKALVAALLALDAYTIALVVERYYAGQWASLARALPF